MMVIACNCGLQTFSLRALYTSLTGADPLARSISSPVASDFKEFPRSTSPGPSRGHNKSKRHIQTQMIETAEIQHFRSTMLVGGSESKLSSHGSSKSSLRQRKRRVSRSTSPRAFHSASQKNISSGAAISSGTAFYSRIVAQQKEKRTSSKGESEPSSPLLRPVLERRCDNFKLHGVGTPSSY